MLPFSVQFQSGLPPSDQLVDAIRKAIARGEISDEAPFPSVRTLARELRISPTTAHKAVLQLKEEGLLFSQPGVGMRVRMVFREGWQGRLDLLRPQLEALLREAESLQVPPEILQNWIETQLKTFTQCDKEDP